MSNIFLHAGSQVRVGLPTIKPLPPNPHIRAGPADDVLARALAPPSKTAETDTDSDLSPEVPALKELRQKLLACDQRSFLTGSASADLQAAHIINAVRKPNHQVRKMEVGLTNPQFQQVLLSQQRLHPPNQGGFLLDGPSNAILSEPDAKAILDALRQSNRDWKKHYEATHDFPVRPLDRRLSTIRLGTLSSFIRTRCSQMNLDYPGKGGSLRLIIFVQCLSPMGLSLPSQPRTCASISAAPAFPLAMIINAHWKLDHFMGEHAGSATPRVKSMAALMSDLVTEIFYVPPGYPCDLSIDTVAPDHSSRGQLATASTEQYLGAGHVDSAGETSALSSESRPSGAPDFEAPEAPEDEDEDGLTNTEFHLLSAQARDPALDSRQRANAAMIMLFGTRQPTNPYVERTRAIDAFNNMTGESGSGGYHPDQSQRTE